MDSADIGRLVLEVLLIKPLFFRSSSPQGYQMIVFSVFIFPDFQNHRIETSADPSYQRKSGVFSGSHAGYLLLRFDVSFFGRPGLRFFTSVRSLGSMK